MEIKKIILSVCVVLLSSCVDFSNQVKLYKVFAGGYDTSGNEKSQTDLTYYGKKNESLEDASYKWHQFASEHCFNGEYHVTKTSTPLLSGTIGARKIEEVIVYFVEPNHWPQVNATYVCNRPL